MQIKKAGGKIFGASLTAAVWLCTHKLKEIGVDVEDWYRQKE